jgi:hypothetical protein
MSMLKRLVSASVLALAVAASTCTGALAASAGNVAAAGSAGQVAAPQVAAPAIDCVPGIITTVCQVVLGPLCKSGCGVNTSSPAQSTGAAATRAVSPQRTTAAPATAASATPTLYCEPQFQILCTVLGLTLCRTHPCGADATASATAAPRIYCDVPVLCLILALTVCRNGCAVDAATATPAEPAVNPIGDLCTVNMRPNPFCSVP